MKKRTLFMAVLLAIMTQLFGQGITIHLKNGDTFDYKTTEIDKITFTPSSPSSDPGGDTPSAGYLQGKWHLGFWVRGTLMLQFDGTEYIEFDGNKMTWAGRQDGSDTYTLSYAADNKSFVATNVNKATDVSTWEIIEFTEKLLVLRNGGADRYFYPTMEEAQNAELDVDAPNHAENTDINAIMQYAGGYTQSSSTPMGIHYQNKRAATDTDKTWLLDPANEPNTLPSAGLVQWVAKTVNLYPYDTPMPADVNQHAVGDCSACAVFASFAYLYPEFIKSIITNNGDDTYTVSMFDAQGNPVKVCVSNKILCSSDGAVGQVTGKNNVVTWATILEKAFMKWETCFGVDNVEGIGTEFLAPLFTGDGDSFAFSPNTLHTSELKTFIEWSLQQGYITIGGFNVAGLQCGELETVTAHAFTFMLSGNSSSVFAMRNPWGLKSVDGVLEIPNKRSVVKTIDVRAVKPGAAAPYLRQGIQPYTPPVFAVKPTDIGVSERLLIKARTNSKTNELW